MRILRFKLKLGQTFEFLHPSNVMMTFSEKSLNLGPHWVRTGILWVLSWTLREISIKNFTDNWMFWCARRTGAQITQNRISYQSLNIKSAWIWQGFQWDWSARRIQRRIDLNSMSSSFSIVHRLFSLCILRLMNFPQQTVGLLLWINIDLMKIDLRLTWKVKIVPVAWQASTEDGHNKRNFCLKECDRVEELQYD